MKNTSGFTLLEVLLTMALIGIITGLASVGLTSFQGVSSTSTSVDRLISDIKYQQQNAMLGRTNNGQPQRFGVYFEKNSYVLFEGDVYNPENENNLLVKLSGGVEFTNISLPQSSIIFEKGSGDFMYFNALNNSVTLADDTQISLSRLGVISVTE